MSRAVLSYETIGRMSAPSIRARVRAEMTEEIKSIARRHLASDGANLSLRAVARDLGVVSSAVYRYFASRDELLTALILDGYGSMADAAEAAEAAVPRRDLYGRWVALVGAIRQWVHDNPHEFALLYGTPVPGYAAPQDPMEPATRPVLLFINLLRDGVERGVLTATGERLPKPLKDDLAAVANVPGFHGLPPTLHARAFLVWTQLFGS